MRYPASEKLEIIRLVERSHLPVKQTLAMLGIARTTFYRWYARYRHDGAVALQVGAVCCERVCIYFPVKQGKFREFGQLDPRMRPLHSD